VGLRRSVPVGHTGAVTHGMLAGARTAGSTPIDSAPGGQARILTGEAVHLDVRLAGLGSRALARMIDTVVQVVLTYLLLLVVFLGIALLGYVGAVTPDEAITDAASLLAIAVGLLGYPVLFETLIRGRTPGKLILGLRVVRDDGGPITFRHAMTRALVGFAIEWPGLIGAPLTWIATIWIMIVSPAGKRLGDHVAGTVVIHERTPAASGWALTVPPQLAGWATMLDLAGLDDDLALATRDFLARYRQIKEPARSRLGDRLAREVAAVTNPPPPPGTPVWAYLAAVHAERHRRALAQLATVRSRAATFWPELAPVVAVPVLPHPRLPVPPPLHPTTTPSGAGPATVPSGAGPATVPAQIRRAAPNADWPK
jgi:uncharacterized RDD family membrane protein YckC